MASGFTQIVGFYDFTIYSFHSNCFQEERFLFPAYPLICLCGAISIHSIQIIYSFMITEIFGKFSRKLPSSHFISIATAVVMIFLGISRILALYKGKANIDCNNCFDFLESFERYCALFVKNEKYLGNANFILSSLNFN